MRPDLRTLSGARDSCYPGEPVCRTGPEVLDQGKVDVMSLAVSDETDETVVLELRDYPSEGSPPSISTVTGAGESQYASDGSDADPDQLGRCRTRLLISLKAVMKISEEARHGHKSAASADATPALAADAPAQERQTPLVKSAQTIQNAP